MKRIQSEKLCQIWKTTLQVPDNSKQAEANIHLQTTNSISTKLFFSDLFSKKKQQIAIVET
jgi:hypothetical protein